MSAEIIPISLIRNLRIINVSYRRWKEIQKIKDEKRRITELDKEIQEGLKKRDKKEK